MEQSEGQLVLASAVVKLVAAGLTSQEQDVLLDALCASSDGVGDDGEVAGFVFDQRPRRRPESVAIRELMGVRFGELMSGTMGGTNI